MSWRRVRGCRILETDVRVSDEADAVELEDRAPVDDSEKGALEVDELGARAV